MGRNFQREEEEPGGANVAIISDAFWHSHFGGQTDVIGRTITVDARSVEIVGILPATFQYPFQQPGPQIWFPRVFETSFMTPDRIRAGASYLTAVARLRSGASIADAEAELQSLNDVYRKTYPGFYDAGRYTAHAYSLKENLVGQVRTPLLVLLTAVGFVLLIGCANLASLMLARATTRRKEMAIRQALGASRSQLVRQLLTESMLLSFIGGGIGLLLAASTPALLRLLPPGTLFRVNEVTVDLRVMWFSLALCLLTGIVVGLMPALQVSGNVLHDALKEATRGSSGGARAGRSRSALVVAQVAVALVLVSSAGLLIQSFGRLMHVSPGFRSDQVMSFSFSLPLTKYPHRPEQAEFYRRVVEAAQQAPGVQFAAVNTFLPMASPLFTNICPEGIVCQGGGKDPAAAVRAISPDYFKTMRIPLLRGREFNEFDTADSRTVCIINEALANQYFAGTDAVGRFIILPYGNIKMEIAGVVGNVKFLGLNQENFAELYYPQLQSAVPVSTSSLVVRSGGPTQPLVSSVREIVRKLDPDLPMTNILSMDEVVSTSLAQPRLTARLVGAFAFIALVLAAIGIYGVMAYSVTQRKHEMAIRIALGANPSSILKLIVKQALTLIIAGVALGMVATLGVTRLFAAILFQVSARDPYTLAAVAGSLIAVGMLACYLPAQRAMSVDPITALRDE
jgi:putative ABC transport system permease protein